MAARRLRAAAEGGAPRLEGPVYGQILERGDRAVLLLGEVHSRSACRDGEERSSAMSVPQLLGRVLREVPAPGRVDLFIEHEEERVCKAMFQRTEIKCARTHARTHASARVHTCAW